MLQKLAKLGRMVPESEFEVDPLNLNKNYSEKNIVFLCFSWGEEEQKFRFTGVELEEFVENEYQKYLYVSVSGRGTSNFPTIDIFTKEDLFFQGQVDFAKSKSGKKLIAIFKKYKPAFDTLEKELLENNELHQILFEKIKDLKRFLLSIKIDKKYPVEYPIFEESVKQAQEQIYNSSYYEDKGKKYVGKNAICSLSQKQSEEVWGYASPYSFYAVKTEKSVVSGGFDAKKAWKNFPVSPEETLNLEKAQKFLEKYLNFRFCGYSYFLVPEFVIKQQNDDEQSETQLDFLKDFTRYNLSDENQKYIEADLIEFLSDSNNSANYTLFFYEKNNAEFKILASIDDVFPSHGKKLKEIRSELEEESLFSSYLSDTYKNGLKFQFHFIKTFLPNNKMEGNFKSDFLKMVRSIFMQKQLSFNYLLQHIVRKLRADFVNNAKESKINFLKALMLLKFLDKANLIQITNDYDEVVMENIYEDFFVQHPNFFTTNSRKAIFLEGVLCKKLLNLQYSKRESQPFFSRLNGLKLNKKDIQRLLPEIINKLREYDSAYPELESLVSRYLLDATFNLTMDEVSFYFIMGMNLAGEFKKENTKESESK